MTNSQTSTPQRDACSSFWRRWGSRLTGKISTTTAALFLAAGLGQAANVLTDPGFELGGSTWSMNTWAGTSQLDSTVAHTGTNSWKFNGDQGAGAWNGGRQLNVPVQDTKFYRYSAWVNVPSARVDASLTFTFRHNVGAGGVDLGSSNLTAPGWTQVFGPYVQPVPGTTTFGYVGFHDFSGNVIYYVDDLAVEETDALVLQGRVVDGTGTGVPGATVSASSAAFSPAATTTDGTGHYSFSVPPGTYTLGANTPGFKGSGTATVSSSPTTAVDIVLGVDPDYDTDLLFSLRSSAFAAGQPWPCAYPAGTSLTRIGGNPTALTINGQQWEFNHQPTADGFQFPGPGTGGAWDTAIPVNGATIVTAVRPIRVPGYDTRGEVVDIMYDRLVLAVNPANGRIMVGRQASWWDSGAATLPNGQITILSLVVQPDGSFRVYTNGTEVMNITDTAQPMTALDPTLPWTDWYTHYINVGRNQPDGWPIFNGNIGDTYVYKVALDDTKRTALESSLQTKYGTSASYTITATAGAGGSIAPAGAVAVPQNVDQTFTITPGTYDDITGLLVDGRAVDVSATPNSAIYTFTSVTNDHTIAASFTEWPLTVITGKVAQADGTGVAGVLVSATGGRAPYTATTAADGTYSIRVKPGITYAVAARLPGWAVVPASLTATGPNDLTGKNFTASYVGPQKLVDLKFDASWTDGMSLTNWTNSGILGGVFVADGGKGTAAATVSTNYLGSNAVAFANSKLMLSTNGTTADAALVRTPVSLSANGPYTVFAQIASISELAGEQYYLAFAHNGGDGNCAAFDFGTAPAWGAVAHWGWRDMGWSNPEATGGPYSGMWHYVAITFDGSVERVYLDGAEVNSEAKSLPLYSNNPFVIGSRFEDDNGNGLSAPFTGALAALQVYDMALTPKQIAGMSGGAPSYYWSGPNNGNWSAPLNWNNTVPGYGNIAVFSDTATAGRTVQLDNYISVKGLQFNGLVTNTTIASSSGNTLSLGDGVGAASISVAGSAVISAPLNLANSLTVSMGSSNDSLTLSGTVGGIGSIDKNTAGTLTLSGSDTILGQGVVRDLLLRAGSTVITGPVTLINDYGTTHLYMGGDGTQLTIGSGGKLFANGGDWTGIGATDGGIGGGNNTVPLTVTVKGNGIFQQGTNGNASIVLANGSGYKVALNVQDTAQVIAPTLSVGYQWGTAQQATVNQSGGTVNLGSATAGGLTIGVGTTTVSTYNFDGGLLVTRRIRGSSGNSTFNFNGGTIHPQGTYSGFLQAVTTANIKAGGLIIDTSDIAVSTTGYDIGAAQNLGHDASGPAIDGGLTKKGLGSLTLSGTNTYTGPTRVQAGMLICTNSPSSLAGGTLDISTGAKVALNYTGTRFIAALSFGGVAQPNGTYGPTGSGAATIDDVHFAGTGTVTVGPVTIPVPVLLPAGFTHPSGVPTFTFDTVAGYKYRVVYKNALSDTSWQELAPGFVLSTGAPMTVTDPAVGQPQRFYRIEAAIP